MLSSTGLLHLLALLLPLLPLTNAALNEPCFGTNDVAGVCFPLANCTDAEGTPSYNPLCIDPDDPTTFNLRCCTQPDCSLDVSGPSNPFPPPQPPFPRPPPPSSSGQPNCRWTSDCSGNSVAGSCAGPVQMQCCSVGGSGFGGYATPNIIPGSPCAATAVAGVRLIVRAFPGRVREVVCARNCACPGTSDHCCGLATDLMISDQTGLATLSGRDIAEWIMINRNALGLKYVVYGQKIWSPWQDEVTRWANWRVMDDGGSITANNWDQVHVSYKG